MHGWVSSEVRRTCVYTCGLLNDPKAERGGCKVPGVDPGNQSGK